MHPESFLSNFRGACHLEVTLFSCLLASSRRPFRALKMRPVRQVLFCVPQKRRRVPEKAVLRTECPFRTVEACFCAPSASENASRTTGSLFWHRISLPYRRSLFFTPNASENTSRTTGSLFEHRVSLPYHRRAFPVPSSFEGVGKGSAGDKFRVSGTQEMVEETGANKESGALTEANFCRCGTSNITIEAG